MVVSLRAFLIITVSCIFGLFLTHETYLFCILPIIGIILLLNPIFAIICWLIFEILFGNYQIFGANPRTYISLLSFFFVIKELMLNKRKNLNSVVAFVNIPLAILFLGILINVLRETPLTDYFRWIITLSSNIMMVFFLGLAVRDIKSLKKIMNAFLLIVAVNAIVGIMQFLGVEQAYLIRTCLFKNTIYAPQGRIIGLARDAIEYSYVLQLGSVILLGFHLTRNINIAAKKYGLYMLSLVIGLGFLLNGTRSAIGGVILTILFLVSFGKTIWKTNIFSMRRVFFLVAGILSLSVIISVFFLVSDKQFVLSSQQMLLADSSAIGRIPRIELALKIFSHNLLGIGGFWNYERVFMPYWGSIGVLQGIDQKNISSHNHFLTAFLYYGIPGGILLIAFMIKIFNCLIINFHKTTESFLKTIFLSGGLWLIAYSFNSSFHNAGPLEGDNLFWFFIGLFVASINISNAHMSFIIASNSSLHNREIS